METTIEAEKLKIMDAAKRTLEAGYFQRLQNIYLAASRTL